MRFINKKEPEESKELELKEPTVVGESEAIKDDRFDEAAAYLAQHTEFAPMTPEQEKKLVRKIDSWLLPLLFLTATLGAVDKVETGTASLYGFQQDNHMHGQEYSWLSSILNLGQLAGLFIASFLIHRVRPGRMLAVASVLWSILTCMYPAATNWSGLMALRFLMGLLESVNNPCLTMLITNFYKKHEQAPRNSRT